MADGWEADGTMVRSAYMLVRKVFIEERIRAGKASRSAEGKGKG